MREEGGREKEGGGGEVEGRWRGGGGEVEGRGRGGRKEGGRKMEMEGARWRGEGGEGGRKREGRWRWREQCGGERGERGWSASKVSCSFTLRCAVPGLGLTDQICIQAVQAVPRVGVVVGLDLGPADVVHDLVFTLTWDLERQVEAHGVTCHIRTYIHTYVHMYVCMYIQLWKLYASALARNCSNEKVKYSCKQGGTHAPMHTHGRTHTQKPTYSTYLVP